MGGSLNSTTAAGSASRALLPSHFHLFHRNSGGVRKFELAISEFITRSRGCLWRRYCPAFLPSNSKITTGLSTP